MIGRREHAIELGVLLFLSALILFPIVGLALQVATAKGGGVLETMDRVWKAGGFESALLNSTIVAVSTTCLTVAVSVFSGFALGAMRFPGANVVFYILILGLIVPLAAYVVPLYYELRGLQLLDTYAGIVLPLTAQLSAFATLWMRARFRAMPPSLVDAARVDGATTWQILVRILLPLARPAILALAALVFLWSWNDLLLSLIVISSPELRTAPLQLGIFIGQRSTDLAALASAALFVSLPVLIVYVVLQRHIISGVTSGAVRE
jgi:raffinose/stachyose/melibiose transport system permease protein